MNKNKDVAITKTWTVQNNLSWSECARADGWATYAILLFLFFSTFPLILSLSLSFSIFFHTWHGDTYPPVSYSKHSATSSFITTTTTTTIFSGATAYFNKTSVNKCSITCEYLNSDFILYQTVHILLALCINVLISGIMIKLYYIRVINNLNQSVVFDFS